MEESSKLKNSEHKEENGKKNELMKSKLSKDNGSFSMPIEVKSKEENEDVVNLNMNLEFQSKKNMIVRVYGLIAIQFTLSLGFVLIFNLKSIKIYILEEYYELCETTLYYTSALFVIVLIGISTTKNLIKIPPYNYIILIAFSLYQIIFCSFMSFLYVRYYYQTIVMGLILSIISCLVIIIYAHYSKNEFNHFYIFLFILFSQILITWFILVFMPVKEFYILLGFGIAFFLGIYFNYDVGLMNEKNENYINRYTFHDYIFALLEVYTDAVRLLLIKWISDGFSELFKSLNKNENI